VRNNDSVAWHAASLLAVSRNWTGSPLSASDAALKGQARPSSEFAASTLAHSRPVPDSMPAVAVVFGVWLPAPPCDGSRPVYGCCVRKVPPFFARRSDHRSHSRSVRAGQITG